MNTTISSVSPAIGATSNVIRLVRDMAPSRIQLLERKVAEHQRVIDTMTAEIVVLQALMRTVSE